MGPQGSPEGGQNSLKIEKMRSQSRFVWKLAPGPDFYRSLGEKVVGKSDENQEGKFDKKSRRRRATSKSGSEENHVKHSV